jgi:hypothetical protein
MAGSSREEARTADLNESNRRMRRIVNRKEMHCYNLDRWLGGYLKQSQFKKLKEMNRLIITLFTLIS